MQRRLIIHIGLPKTGSTALQTFFSRNRAPLLADSIDYLPLGEFAEGQAGRIASGNGAYLARSMLQKQKPAALAWEDKRVSVAFRSAIENSTAKTLLLSSELFTVARMEVWSNILATCKEYDLAICFVAVVRNQSDWLSSSYLQQVKRHQLTAGPEEFITDLYRKTKFLQYNWFFSQLAGLTSGRLGFVSFDKTALNNSLIPETLRQLGVSDLTPYEIVQKPINITPAPEEIAFLRLCNHFSPNMTFSDILATPDPRDAPDSSAALKRWTVISPALAKGIVGHFKEENEKFLSTFKLSGDFFAAPSSNFVDIDSVNFSASKLASIMARYLTAHDQRMRAISQQLNALQTRLFKAVEKG